MLVLTRKVNERIELCDPNDESFGVIIITQCGGNRIGIEAPRNVKIARAELAGKGGAK